MAHRDNSTVRCLLTALVVLTVCSCSRQAARTQDVFLPAEARSEILALLDASQPGPPLTELKIDYPFNGAVFPPDMVAPTVLWHDPNKGVDRWLITVTFGEAARETSTDTSLASRVPGTLTRSATQNRGTGSGMLPRIFALTDGTRPAPQFDPLCTAHDADWPDVVYLEAAKGWTPPADVWEMIKRGSVVSEAVVRVYGVSSRAGAEPDLDPLARDPSPAARDDRSRSFRGEAEESRLVSCGSVVLRTSPDPVGAPIFYRDVPLMPSEGKSGIIKPLADTFLPMIQWRLRDIARPASVVALEGMPTCANCHSFSADGNILGMDIDGPDGDKGAYATVAIQEKTVITTNNMMNWNDYPDAKIWPTFGLFSRVSPDGRYVVSSVEEKTYVQNYKDYRFLQTFYPTRGILAIYDRRTGTIRALPGADDPAYVQCNAVWSSDGNELVFIRAEARDSYGDGAPSNFANDPRETQIQYDLYRIPFNGGEGGVAQPVSGASRNGMSNSFPKFSPDGKWIVFVQAGNGLLMRPDSRLFIIPSEGGEARPLGSNLHRMNSWHSWSPNSRWLVFSSKSFSPYTQMFLTHIDEDGSATPPVLVPNSTAANRAVNLPEFVNRPAATFRTIDTPAVAYRHHMRRARELYNAGAFAQAEVEAVRSLHLKGDYHETLDIYGCILAAQGKLQASEQQFKGAIEAHPGYATAYQNLGAIYSQVKQFQPALACYRKALELDPGLVVCRVNLGVMLEELGRPDEAAKQYAAALELARESDEHRGQVAGIEKKLKALRAQ